MNPEQWAQIKPIFHEAAERPVTERSAFIRSRCGDDESLAVEIESLLGAHDRAGSFIEELPLDSITAALDVELSDAIIGRRIGAYEVTARLAGAGWERSTWPSAPMSNSASLSPSRWSRPALITSGRARSPRCVSDA